MATSLNNNDDGFIDIDDFDSDGEGADVSHPTGAERLLWSSSNFVGSPSRKTPLYIIKCFIIKSVLLKWLIKEVKAYLE